MKAVHIYLKLQSVFSSDFQPKSSPRPSQIFNWQNNVIEFYWHTNRGW